MRRARLGAAARALVESNRGAKDKSLAVITPAVAAARRHDGRRPPVPPRQLDVVRNLQHCFSFSTADSLARDGGTFSAGPISGGVSPRPSISVGNLTVGGSGKTPLAGEIARLLIDMGERPSILSRGYARMTPADGVVIVSDGRRRFTTDVAHAGDEPYMLARAVPGAVVVVNASRYLAGRVAESQARMHRSPARRWLSAFAV